VDEIRIRFNRSELNTERVINIGLL